MSDKQCPVCLRKHVGPIKLWRRHTQYPKFYLNFLKSCVHCIRGDDYYFHDMWAEYYSSQGYCGDYRQRLDTSYVKPKRVQHVHAHRRIW